MCNISTWLTVFFLCLYVTVNSLRSKPSLLSVISAGKVYSIDNWIPDKQVSLLRDFCSQLQKEGLFQASGLSYAEPSSGESITTERLVCDEIPSHHLDNKALNDLTDKIDEIRKEISATLSRPSMRFDNLPHESYISISNPGTFLKRHMDEKHEELKSSNRWSLGTRRSISWLLYLNEKSWDSENNGGMLRSFPQKAKQHPKLYGPCGCHQGNLQVGWLTYGNQNENESGNESGNENGVGNTVKPVYMKSWVITDENEDENNATPSHSDSTIRDRSTQSSSSSSSKKKIKKRKINPNQSPSSSVISALYVISIFKRKIFITDKFFAHDEGDITKNNFENNSENSFDKEMQSSSSTDKSINQAETTKLNFLDKCHKYMKPNYFYKADSENNKKYGFSLIENYGLWINDENNKDLTGRSKPPKNTISSVLLPRGGTLCLFDSVSLPHEVLKTVCGERLAIAGWFHEKVEKIDIISSNNLELKDLNSLNNIDIRKELKLNQDQNQDKLINSYYQDPSSDTKIIDNIKNTGSTDYKISTEKLMIVQNSEEMNNFENLSSKNLVASALKAMSYKSRK